MTKLGCFSEEQLPARLLSPSVAAVVWDEGTAFTALCSHSSLFSYCIHTHAFLFSQASWLPERIKSSDSGTCKKNTFLEGIFEMSPSYEVWMTNWGILVELCLWFLLGKYQLFASGVITCSPLRKRVPLGNRIVADSWGEGVWWWFKVAH